MHRSEYRYRSSERLTSPIRPEREERDSKGKETVGFVPFGLGRALEGPRFFGDSAR